MDDIVSERILHKVERIENDFRDELHSLSGGGVINATLEDTTTVTMSGYLDEVGCDSIVDELVILRDEFVEAFLDNLGDNQIDNLMNKDTRLTWLPFKSFIKATTFMLKARINVLICLGCLG